MSLQFGANVWWCTSAINSLKTNYPYKISSEENNELTVKLQELYLNISLKSFANVFSCYLLVKKEEGRLIQNCTFLYLHLVVLFINILASNSSTTMYSYTCLKWQKETLSNKSCATNWNTPKCTKQCDIWNPKMPHFTVTPQPT